MLDSIGTAVKAGLAALLLAGLAGAAWLYFTMKAQIGDLTEANADLQASVGVANAAAEISAKSAQAIAAADTAAQTIVAASHAAVTAANLKTDQIMGDFNRAAPSDLLCPADVGLPLAYMRSLDRLFGQSPPPPVEVPEVQIASLKPPLECLQACPAWPSLSQPLEAMPASQRAAAALGIQLEARKAYDACAAQVQCIADFEAKQ